jgi:hypothetical protein
MTQIRPIHNPGTGNAAAKHWPRRRLQQPAEFHSQRMIAA